MKKVIETQTGVVAESNTSEIADRIAKSVSSLNEALSRLSLDRAEVSAALHKALDSLTASGISGLSLAGEPRTARLTVDRDKLTSALSKLTSAEIFVDVAMKPLQDLADSTQVDPHTSSMRKPVVFPGFEANPSVDPFIKRPSLVVSGKVAVKAYAFPAISGRNYQMTVR